MLQDEGILNFFHHVGAAAGGSFCPSGVGRRDRERRCILLLIGVSCYVISPNLLHRNSLGLVDSTTNSRVYTQVLREVICVQNTITLSAGAWREHSHLLTRTLIILHEIGRAIIIAVTIGIRAGKWKSVSILRFELISLLSVYFDFRSHFITKVIFFRTRIGVSFRECKQP